MIFGPLSWSQGYVILDFLVISTCSVMNNTVFQESGKDLTGLYAQ